MVKRRKIIIQINTTDFTIDNILQKICQFIRKGEKIMKALLIHTDGYSIDVVGKYSTKEEASCALYKEFEKMCSQGIDPEWQERSHCDYEDAILYLNGEDVHVWQVVTA